MIWERIEFQLVPWNIRSNDAIVEFHNRVINYFILLDREKKMLYPKSTFEESHLVGRNRPLDMKLSLVKPNYKRILHAAEWEAMPTLTFHNIRMHYVFSGTSRRHAAPSYVRYPSVALSQTQREICIRLQMNIVYIYIYISNARTLYRSTSLSQNLTSTIFDIQWANRAKNVMNFAVFSIAMWVSVCSMHTRSKWI